jgi:hypothetical protein
MKTVVLSFILFSSPLHAFRDDDGRFYRQQQPLEIKYGEKWFEVPTRKIDFAPSRNGFSYINARAAYLKDSLHSSYVRIASEHNKNFGQWLMTHVGPNINLFDRGGYAVKNNLTVESRSRLSGLYEPKSFSDVKVKDNRLDSFRVNTARGNWIVKEHVRDIRYGTDNRPARVTLKTTDIGNNQHTQKIYNLAYTVSSDQNRYHSLRGEADGKINLPEHYNWGEIAEKLSQMDPPPTTLPASFTLEATSPLGNKTLYQFEEVLWKNDGVIGFKVAIQDSGIAFDAKVTPRFDATGDVAGFDVSPVPMEKAIASSVTDILGSAGVQIGNTKIPFLEKRYDGEGYLDQAKNTYAIDYKITDEEKEANQFKTALFELEQSAPTETRSVLWNQNIGAMDKEALKSALQEVRGKIEKTLQQSSGLTLEGTRIKSAPDYRGETLPGAVFVLNGGPPQVVQGPFPKPEIKPELSLKDKAVTIWNAAVEKARPVAEAYGQNVSASVKAITQTDPLTANKVAVGMVVSFFSRDLFDEPFPVTFDKSGHAVVAIWGRERGLVK